VRLAASNIAWPPEDDAEAAAILAESGVAAVEVTPSRVRGGTGPTDARRAHEYRRFWEDRGLPIVAMQALLFGHGDLVLFSDSATRGRLLDHLSRVIDVAAVIGASNLVFGSPRNRSRGSLAPEKAEAIAVGFFRQLARRAADRGVCMLIEPNPPAYGCDFLVDARETIAFVESVNERGLGVHLDAGAIHLSGEDPDEAVRSAGRLLRHFHASEPGLVPLGDGGVDHAPIGSVLRDAAYEGFVSIEMVQARDGLSWQERLRRAIAVARNAYGDAGLPSTAAA
jgi:D-psicose/D-tagatose/L-ribulose 3-epimerase